MKCPVGGEELSESQESWSCAHGEFALGADLEAAEPALTRRLSKLKHGKVAFPCPACSGDMDRTQAIKIEIERCIDCGSLWLDDGERERLDQQEDALSLTDGGIKGWLWWWIGLGGP